MTVKELIEELTKCDPEAIVHLEYEVYVEYSELTDGYETQKSNLAAVNDLETWVVLAADNK